MGPKSFEQAAGFLKIPESGEVLDNTWVHPENYAVARDIREELQKGGTVTTTGGFAASALPSGVLARIKEQYKVGDTTINDIIEELKKPNRDPRDGYPKPIMQKGVINFEDLNEGMKVTGKIKNVVDFGAFVDLGIKETALVHISELSDTFVKDPMSIVKVGDVLEFRIIGLDLDRRRISLSRKSEQAGVKAGGGRVPVTAHAGSDTGEKKRVVVKKAGGDSSQGNSGGKDKPPFSKPPFSKPSSPKPRNDFDRDSDGTMYNPFAEAFKKMQEKKK